MSGDLFGGGLGQPRVRVLMALDPEYYELMWTGLKTHEFRRRFPQGVAVQWFTYLTKQTGALGAIIDLERRSSTPRRGSPRSPSGCAPVTEPRCTSI